MLGNTMQPVKHYCIVNYLHDSSAEPTYFCSDIKLEICVLPCSSQIVCWDQSITIIRRIHKLLPSIQQESFLLRQQFCPSGELAHKCS